MTSLPLQLSVVFPTFSDNNKSLRLSIHKKPQGERYMYIGFASSKISYFTLRPELMTSVFIVELFY